MRLLAATLATLGLLAASRPATACTVDICSAQPGTPIDGRTLPSGTTLLPVRTSPDMKPAELYLGDVAIATTTETTANPSEQVLRAAPLAPGHYRLVHFDSCGKNIKDGMNTSEFDVGATPAVAPASIGTITVERTFIAGNDTLAACGASPTADRVAYKISFKPSVELEPLLPLFEISTNLAGPYSGESRLGAGRTAMNATVLTALNIACGDAPSTIATVPKGTYTVSATGRILGSDMVLPSTSLQFAANCDGFEAKRTDPGANESDDGGCSQTSKRGGSMAWLGGVALVALVLVRRRR